LAQLKALAEQASEGFVSPRDAAYIAAAHPGTVLALIAENERLKKGEVERELRIMQLAGISTASIQNTGRTVKGIATESALTAEQDKARQLRERVESVSDVRQKVYREKRNPYDEGMVDAFDWVLSQLDALGIAPVTPRETT
jgi:hypothetical protein